MCWACERVGTEILVLTQLHTCLSVCQTGSFQPTTACLPLVQGTSCDIQSHQRASLSVERAGVPGFPQDWWKSVSHSGGFRQLGEKKKRKSMVSICSS